MTNVETEGTIYKKVCDQTGEEVVMDRPNATPLNWFRLENIKLLYRTQEYYEKPNGKKTRLIPSEHVLKYEGDTDPDFVSKEALMEWLSNRIDEITEE